MANNEHQLDKTFIALHKKEKSTQGGACLNRHESAFNAKSSCSHRWQAYEKAKECANWYNYPAYQDLVKTVARTPSFETTQWGNFISTMKRPMPGEWDLTATTQYKSGKRIDNFVEWSKCPYWHNAHHIIPHSILNNAIANASEEELTLYTLIRVSLLEAQYNLNHKNNMVLLPMGKEVAAALGLPRHIAGIEGTADGYKYTQDHPKYSDNIGLKVSKIIRAFAKQIKLKKHDAERPAFSKAQLEDISKDIFNQLRTWQKHAKQGAPLDDAPIS